MVRRKVRDEADARSCLAQVVSSRKPRADWARENGVDARSLNMWRLNLERAGRAHVQVVRPRVVELVAHEPETGPRARYVVRVGELRVEVDEHFDADVLRRLISAVSSC